MKEILKQLKKYIRKNWGVRCKDFDINCLICLQYLALDILVDNLVIEEMQKENGKSA